MDRNDVLKAVEVVAQDIFDDDGLVLTEQTSSEDVEEWDSLNHINLMSAVQQDLGISFSLAELMGLKNIGDLVSLSISKLDDKD